MLLGASPVASNFIWPATSPGVLARRTLKHIIVDLKMPAEATQVKYLTRAHVDLAWHVGTAGGRGEWSECL